MKRKNTNPLNLDQEIVWVTIGKAFLNDPDFGQTCLTLLEQWFERSKLKSVGAARESAVLGLKKVKSLRSTLEWNASKQQVRYYMDL